MRRAAALALAAAALAGGCGGGGNGGAAGVVDDTLGRLDEVRSGELTLHLVVEPIGTGETVGFELDGPFALAAEGKPAVGRFHYVQLRGENRGDLTVIVADGKAYVETQGSTYELPEATSQELQESAAAGPQGLEELGVGGWLIEPELVEQNGSDVVRGRVDAVEAIQDLLAIARDLGGSELAPLDEDGERQVREAVKSSTFELERTEDGLLSRLDIRLELGVDVPQELRETLGGSLGARVRFEFGLANPNTPVSVEEPTGALPYDQLVG